MTGTCIDASSGFFDIFWRKESTKGERKELKLDETRSYHEIRY